MFDDFIAFSNEHVPENDEIVIQAIIKYGEKIQLNQLDSFNVLVSAGQKIKQLAEVLHGAIVFMKTDSSNHVSYQKYLQTTHTLALLASVWVVLLHN